ncbi:MAG: DNA-deoxyinosine glycosylase [Clostridiaceae bacterium]|jgi:TDG/mug DNA glycosylase family protein|nr:DNA-deoxyinosine glycosylase [Clostridiaceae bacterium]
MIYSFAPIIDESCSVLLLGTMPGAESLRRQQYYGYEHNVFWRIIYKLFDREPDGDYVKRIAFLLQHSIALWDVLKACEREGSSDSKIKKPVPNDFAGLYLHYPNIKSVCFNGGGAEKLYSRFVEKRGVVASGKGFYKFPSTSPAYTIAFEKKLEQWQSLLPLLTVF